MIKKENLAECMDGKLDALIFSIQLEYFSLLGLSLNKKYLIGIAIPVIRIIPKSKNLKNNSS